MTGQWPESADQSDRQEDSFAAFPSILGSSGVPVMETLKIIQCRHHEWASWSVICVHLAGGASHEWARIDSSDGNEDDWVCPECLARGVGGLPIEDLRLVCVHCVRELQARHDVALSR
jgi:hypothetical protein